MIGSNFKGIGLNPDRPGGASIGSLLSAIKKITGREVPHESAVSRRDDTPCPLCGPQPHAAGAGVGAGIRSGIYSAQRVETGEPRVAAIVSGG